MSSPTTGKFLRVKLTHFYYANAPIIRNGADWFVSIGTEKSKGTKVFAYFREEYLALLSR